MYTKYYENKSIVGTYVKVNLFIIRIMYTTKVL